jgi:hypothetical protein
MQTKKGPKKMKKDTRKWCEFHKIPRHNINECHSKKSLVVTLKESELEVGSDSESDSYKVKWIIDAEPSATIATTKVKPSAPKEPKEGESLFHL